MYQPVAAEFFNLSGIELARKLLGCYIVHEVSTGLLVGRIIETEAYQGPEDQAAHSYLNRKTKRTAVMFGEPGFVYTYQMHSHTLANVIAGPSEIPHAVLIRALEPVEGIEQMRINRGLHIKDKDLANGPGKLAKAMEISMDYYGHHWTDKPLYIAAGPKVTEVIAGPRIGIGNAGEAVDYPWRFVEKDNPNVSKYRK